MFEFLNAGGVYAIEDIHTLDPNYDNGSYIDSDITVLDYLDSKNIQYDTFQSKQTKNIPALLIVTRAGIM